MLLSKLSYQLILGSLERLRSTDRYRSSPLHLTAGSKSAQSRRDTVSYSACGNAAVLPCLINTPISSP